MSYQPSTPAHGDFDTATLRREFDGIVQQVQKYPPKQISVAVERRLDHFAEPDTHTAAVSDRSHRSRRVVHHILERHVRRLHHQMAGICAGEQEDVIDDAGESARGILHDRHRFPVLGFEAMLAPEGHVGFRSHDRSWRAQLVRGIGHEPALLRKRFFQTVEQLVQNTSEGAQFIVGGDGEPLMQRGGANLGSARCHCRHGCKTSFGQEIPAGCRTRDQQGNCDEEHSADALQRALHFDQRIDAGQAVRALIDRERLRN